MSNQLPAAKTTEYDFQLVVTRIPTQAGSYVVDLSWIHVTNILGYNIYRSESRSDDPNDWYKVNNVVIQVNYYQDRGFTGDPVDQGRIAWFYKVIPVDLSSDELALSRSVAATYDVPLSGIQKYVAPTIRMRTNLLLDPKAFSSAEVVHFLVRKWAGEYCTCLDVRTRKIDASCGLCFGTAYKGGFALIDNVYCRVRSGAKRVMASSPGITVTNDRTAIIATYPRLSEGDILIRKHNARFRVRDPKWRETQNYITAQSFTLERMQLYDMGYRVPAPPIVQPVERVPGGNVLGGILARSEGASTNSGRGGAAIRQGRRNVVGSPVETADTRRTGTGTGRDFVGDKPDYPDS